MATPTPKSKAINDAAQLITGKDREATIKADLCMACDGKAGEFRDAGSVREYTISGMCQTCQDAVFGL